jgi:hypothetical protein
MYTHSIRHLIGYAAQCRRRINLPVLGTTIGSNPELIKGWFYDLGRLVALDGFQELCAEAWAHLLDHAGDDRLDGDLSRDLDALHTLTGAAIDIREQRATILHEFVERGDRYALLTPADGATAPDHDPDTADLDSTGEPSFRMAAGPQVWPPYGLARADVRTLIRIAALACHHAWRGDLKPLDAAFSDLGDASRLCRLGADTWQHIAAADRQSGGPTP